MSLVYIDFRGVKGVRVRYRDYGYESDTGAHVIEWEFEDSRFPGITEVTDEEDEAIVQQLHEISANYGDDLADFGDVVK